MTAELQVRVETNTAELSMAPRGGLENLVRPVVAGLEAMIRAELEQADYGRFARIVRICNQAKSIINIAQAKDCIADWDDPPPSPGATGTVNATTFLASPGPATAFASGANQIRELAGLASELLAPLSKAQGAKERAWARRAEAEELRALVGTLADLGKPEHAAERAWVEGRIKALTAAGVSAAPSGLGEYLSVPRPPEVAAHQTEDV